MSIVKSAIVSFFCIFAPLSAQAKVIDAKPNGFKIEHEVIIDKPQAKVFSAIIKPQKWWLSSHTWSGKSENLYLEPYSGGCFCEKLNPGSVAHLRIVYFKPNVEIRLSGALGPLQTMGVGGHMIYALSQKDGKTILKLTYTIGGYWENGLENLAPNVDTVLGQQVSSLVKYIELGAKNE